MSLFLGVNPALLRAVTYGSFRYAIYSPIKDGLSTEEYANTIHLKILSGCISGCIASAVFSPTDLIKVRMQTGWGNEGYRTILQSFGTVVKTEGFMSLWTGVGPTCARATVLAAAELSTYDHVKHDLLQNKVMEDGALLHFVASLAAGFVASLASNPFDFVKSRIMNQHKSADGVGLLYKNTLDCMVKSVRHDGFFVLWSGFAATFARIGPNIIITFTMMEQLKKYFDTPKTPMAIPLK